ncbi:hypothetical protein ACOMHN_028444 [Nucella lapillus]
MAFTSSPRQSHSQYPDSARSHGRGGDFAPRGPAPRDNNAYYNQQDQSHHDYTNIPSARSVHERYRNDMTPYSNSEGNPGYPNTSSSTRNEEDALARVESLTHQGRDRRGEVGGRRNTTDSVFKRECADLAQQGRLYEDKEFLPVNTSIYYSREASHHSIRWLRPLRICSPERPVFVQGGFSRFDVKQGSLGDCWFVAAMACLCGPDHSGLLERVVPDWQEQTFQDRQYAGMFRFQFWHFGEWKEVVIDDCLPTVRGGLKFVHSAHHAEFWPALMEKAYAKLYGSYEALKGGRMADSLTDLTGGVSESFKLRGKDANYPPNLRAILFKALDRGALIGCGINGGEGSEEGFLSNGLVTGHAYSVTSLRQVSLQGGEVILIRVRNPHGNQNEWKGAWSDGSREWQQVHPKNRERFGLVRRNDGEFWMEFRDFMDNFDSLVVCNLTPDAPIAASRKWFIAEHHGRWVKHFNAGGRPYCRESHWANPQYVLRLEDTDDDDDSSCSVIVQLMQKDRRRLKQKGEVYRYIGFVVYKVPPGYTTPLKKEFFETHPVHATCDSFSNTRQAVKRLVLRPGVYVVVPCTYDKDMEADFYIRFFFEKGNVSEYADEPPEKAEVLPPPPPPNTGSRRNSFRSFSTRCPASWSLG